MGKGFYWIAFKRMNDGLVWRNNGFIIIFYRRRAFLVTTMRRMSLNYALGLLMYSCKLVL